MMHPQTATAFAGRCVLALLLVLPLFAAEAIPAPTPAPSPPFSWDRVPLNIHFGKRKGDLNDAEIEFLATHASLITLEKGHGATVHGSTEKGIADTARRLKAKNPSIQVLFYFNAFINWGGYDAFNTYKPEWTLRNSKGEIVTHPPSKTPRPDPANPAFREWWSEVVAAECRNAPIDGVFVDAVPQAFSPGLKRVLGEAKAQAVVDGIREMVALTKRKIGPDRWVLVNAPRPPDQLAQVLTWDGVDGIMMEHFGAFEATSPIAMKTDLDAMAVAAAKGVRVVLKGWPGFNWTETDMMKRPDEELIQLARAKITFPLACFLIGAQPGTYFCYSWGYTDRDGSLDSYPELNRPLGPPKADAVWQGLTASREFEHASVQVDLNTKQARIDWR